jgi:transcriptional regulator with XRE-family HTH domain
MSSLKIAFGRQLKKLRNQADLSQLELATACGVSADTISHIERGINGPRFDLIEKLTASLGCQPKDLFDFDPL